MSFASVVFFLFLPVVFAFHYAGRSRQWQNSVLLLASYVFYGWWDYRFCGLMLFSSLADYALGRAIASTSNPVRRKSLLLLSFVVNLGLLGFFKYFNFFADSFVVAMAAVGINLNSTTLNIVLPLGISFYTFQTLSYTLDIYYGRFQPRRDLIEYLTFVSFFPQLVAGPIERATHLLPQFSVARVFSPDTAVEGARLFLWGLAKKMILADNLGAIVDPAFANSQSVSGGELAVATVCFAFQIYCDFSAYSDMAAGAASLFGIRLMRNFDYPYFSQSLGGFWRRWHISLSTWFRDYVYIPLGGSRGSNERNAANLLTTFLISGLWHGAAWHFVLWGALHGGLLAGSRWLPISRFVPAKKRDPHGMCSIIRTGRTFLLVCVAWVLFRAESVPDALQIYWRIATDLFSRASFAATGNLVREHSIVLWALAVFIGIEWRGRCEWNPLQVYRWPVAVRWACYTGLFWLILCLGTRRTTDFIYFQF